ncbi:MAG TPA: hypothetical protein O0X70_07555 [Methanocorpusculum sp.]|nr:hypothetical protein [Methanocorpusculum sp.]
MVDIFAWKSTELEKIYLVSRLVYNKEIDAEKAAVKLADIIGNPAHKNIVYFAMYMNMRNGRIFRESGGDEMILYFLRRIAQDNGIEGLKTALKAVWGYSGFKESVGCYMEDLNRGCEKIERDFGLRK